MDPHQTGGISGLVKTQRRTQKNEKCQIRHGGIESRNAPM
jgi:hypothetical protein